MQALVDPKLFIFELFKSHQARYSPAIISIVTPQGWKPEYSLSVSSDTTKLSYECVEYFHNTHTVDSSHCEHLSIDTKESEQSYLVTLSKTTNQVTPSVQSSLSITILKFHDQHKTIVSTPSDVQHTELSKKLSELKVQLVNQAIQFIIITSTQSDIFPLVTGSYIDGLIPDQEKENANFCIKITDVSQPNLTIVTKDKEQLQQVATTLAKLIGQYHKENQSLTCYSAQGSEKQTSVVLTYQQEPFFKFYLTYPTEYLSAEHVKKCTFQATKSAKPLPFRTLKHVDLELLEISEQLGRERVNASTLDIIATRVAVINDISDKNKQLFDAVVAKYQKLHLGSAPKIDPITPALIPMSSVPMIFSQPDLLYLQPTYPMLMPFPLVQSPPTQHHEIQIISSSQPLQSKQKKKHSVSKEIKITEQVLIKLNILARESITRVEMNYASIQHLFAQKNSSRSPSPSTSKSRVSRLKSMEEKSSRRSSGARKKHKKEEKKKARQEQMFTLSGTDDAIASLKFITQTLVEEKSKKESQMDELSSLFSPSIAADFIALTALENKSGVITHTFPSLPYLGIVECQYAGKTETHLDGTKRHFQSEDRYQVLAAQCYPISVAMLQHFLSRHGLEKADSIKIASLISALLLRFTQYININDGEKLIELTQLLSDAINHLATFQNTPTFSINAWRSLCHTLLILLLDKRLVITATHKQKILQVATILLETSIAHEQYDLCAGITYHFSQHWGKWHPSKKSIATEALSHQIMAFVTLVDTTLTFNKITNLNLAHRAKIQCELISLIEDTHPAIISEENDKLELVELKKKAQKVADETLNDLITLDTWAESEADKQSQKIEEIAREHHNKLKHKKKNKTQGHSLASATQSSPDLTSEAGSSISFGTSESENESFETSQYENETTNIAVTAPLEVWKSHVNNALEKYRLLDTAGGEKLEQQALQCADSYINKASILTECSTTRFLKHKVALKKMCALAKACHTIKKDMINHLSQAQSYSKERFPSKAAGITWLKGRAIPEEESFTLLFERFQQQQDIVQISNVVTKTIESYHQALSYFEKATEDDKSDYADYVFGTIKVALFELNEQQQQIINAKSNLIEAMNKRKALFTHLAIYGGDFNLPQPTQSACLHTFQKSAYSLMKEAFKEQAQDLSALYSTAGQYKRDISELFKRMRELEKAQ
ncbi:hypothetical protein D5R81_15790 [Parashewanella spongiae]|uniref:Uncharacterized protein n=1 Tax=Parashewanella spongiae TaxID=342950 RepID=A0A3A6TF71_9GAMM|nr:hypothetical protein [Parashewanella spongiae]MCL1079521.1 hypothetical protein [Parashewanella spongiae]RJY07445.1 hypothetical protein D5R81_15790 [Parashewanella spongiae]